mmetsp:Transcript_34663/g.73059  ORF Transcript_34663/g.73059 Transcript_34663/m.73059 type:complete len:107 (-) Transcript_34663:2594-2914(-)
MAIICSNYDHQFLASSSSTLLVWLVLNRSNQGCCWHLHLSTRINEGQFSFQPFPPFHVVESVSISLPFPPTQISAQKVNACNVGCHCKIASVFKDSPKTGKCICLS